MKGIDISDYQRLLDLSTIKGHGIEFVMLKLGYGTTVIDTCFPSFYDTLTALGIPVGAYFYSLATNEENAIRDARKAITIAGGRKLPLGVFMDVESREQLQLSDSRLTAVVKAFCDEIKANGYLSGAYGSGLNLWGKVGPSYLGNDVLVWEAAWGRSQPFHPCDIWQTSETGHIDGYNGSVDTDECMSERFAALVKGQPQPEPTPAPTPTDDYIKIKMPVVKYGDKGNAVKLMQTLLIMKGCSCGWTGADGDFGPKTEGALVMFKSKNGLTGETCDPQTWAALLEV